MRTASLALLALLVAPALPAATPDPRVDPLLRPGAEIPTGLPGFEGLDPALPLRALLRANLTPPTTAALERRGLVFLQTGSGAPASRAGIQAVQGPLPLLRQLAAEGHPLRVARSLAGRLPPTAVTGPEIEVHDLHAAGPSPVEGFGGEGMSVLDIDSSIDPFHPHFFVADGGAYAWVDADDNGDFDPGVDGLDLDGDGEIAPSERLELLDGWRSWFDGES